MKRTVFTLLFIFTLLFGVSGNAAANGLSGVTGGIHFTAAAFGMEGWMRVNVHATEIGNSATGWVRWQEYNEIDGWRRLVAHPICIVFGESAGAPAAVFAVQIDSKEGWGDGAPGQYILFWTRDGGTPGSNGDEFATLNWPPQDTAPACVYAEPAFLFATIDAGNLMIH